MAGSLQAKLKLEAEHLARVLRKTQNQLVLAESCTAGLAAASLGQIPGISQNFCGSSVVYQSGTKAHWLKVPRRLILAHGSESLPVTEALARQVLINTPQATLSASITGDLGPLPGEPEKVGVIFMACAIKTRSATKIKFSTQIRLRKPHSKDPKKLRVMLQHVASMTLLRMVRQMLSDTLRQPQGD